MLKVGIQFLENQGIFLYSTSYRGNLGLFICYFATLIVIAGKALTDFKRFAKVKLEHHEQNYLDGTIGFI